MESSSSRTAAGWRAGEQQSSSRTAAAAAAAAAAGHTGSGSKKTRSSAAAVRRAAHEQQQAATNAAAATRADSRQVSRAARWCGVWSATRTRTHTYARSSTSIFLVGWRRVSYKNRFELCGSSCIHSHTREKISFNTTSYRRLRTHEPPDPQ